MILTRRRFAAIGLVGGLLAGVDATVRATPVAPGHHSPEDWVGRVFVDERAGADVRSITVTVWRYASRDLASAGRGALADQATAPDLADDISILEVEEFPLSSLPGSLKSWVEVVGDGVREMLFAGGFFHQDLFVWSIVTTGEDRDAMYSLITEVGHDLLSRGMPATPEVEHPFVGGLWDLLPTEDDLPGEFRLYQIVEQDNRYTPEGTPIPPFE